MAESKELGPLEELIELTGVKVPILKHLSKKAGRPIVDFSLFVDRYRASYARLGPIYIELEKRHGKRALELMDKLTCCVQ